MAASENNTNNIPSDCGVTDSSNTCYMKVCSVFQTRGMHSIKGLLAGAIATWGVAVCLLAAYAGVIITHAPVRPEAPLPYGSLATTSGYAPMPPCVGDEDACLANVYCSYTTKCIEKCTTFSTAQTCIRGGDLDLAGAWGQQEPSSWGWAYCTWDNRTGTCWPSYAWDHLGLYACSELTTVAQCLARSECGWLEGFCQELVAVRQGCVGLTESNCLLTKICVWSTAFSPHCRPPD